MSSNYAHLLSDVPQTEKLVDQQVLNNAGGYVYALDDWKRLDRFLVLGSDAPTYYQKAPKLTRENAACVDRCWAADPVRTANQVREMSLTGRAPKNDAAIFALALGAVHSNPAARRAALGEVLAVCRTSTHLFQFVNQARALGKGWGRAMKRTVANWYTSKSVDQLAFQAIKYRSREDYTHGRLLATAHPKHPAEPARDVLYRWMLGKPQPGVVLPAQVQAHEWAMAGERDLLELITTYRLPWEALPTEANKRPDVWLAMLPHLGLTAVLRNLGNLSRIGALEPLSIGEAVVVQRLGTVDDIKRSRIHPFNVLQAMHVYGRGRGERSENTWTPNRRVLDALNKMFYAAFQNVVSTGKRHLLALDVSGSMTSPMMGSALDCRTASAAMALVTMRTEPATHVVGFTAKNSRWGQTAATPLPITPDQDLNTVCATISNLPFGQTDCSLPMIYAAENNIPVDVFVVYTDNETYAGRVHPSVALKNYRKKMGIPAKLVVVGMTATGFTIADPADGGMMDVVGFDSSAPAVIADFTR